MFRLINNLKNRKGFTLIELIVVLAVLAIIMAIAVPRFLGVRETAIADADASTLASVAKLAELEYVRQNLSGTATFNSTQSAAVINSNFAESNIFQTDGYGNVKTIRFDSNGKVDQITITTSGSDKTFAKNAGGKFQ